MRLNDKRTINSFKTIAKTHATMDEKIAIPLYTEYLHFLLTRYGWKVKKILAHYTFKQKKFKKDFVIMNQILRQNAKTVVEKDFYKLMTILILVMSVVTMLTTVLFHQFMMNLRK